METGVRSDNDSVQNRYIALRAGNEQAKHEIINHCKQEQKQMAMLNLSPSYKQQTCI